MRLKGKVALITGAARGIGRACALEFANQEADLVLFDIGHQLKEVPYSLGSKSQLELTANLCTDKGRTVATQLVDITNSNDVTHAVNSALLRFGKIDILLNNAGIALPSGKPVHEVSEEEWATMINVDLTGSWRMIKAVGSSMVARRSGSIINIASTAGLVGYRNFVGYVAAKHGVIGLTKAASLDYAPYKVRVNALCPGSVRDKKEVEGQMLSEIARSLKISLSEYEGEFVKSQPINSLIEPEDVAMSAVWLASNESLRVTGSVVSVDGGYLAQ